MTRSILYSPGFGAGWTTWADNAEMARFMLTYQPFIDAINRGERISGDEDDPLTKAFLEECQSRFGKTPYIGGISRLKVATGEGRVRIHEYDGSELVEWEGEFQGWM